MPGTGGAPAIVLKGSKGATESQDNGLALETELRHDVHALEKLLQKCHASKGSLAEHTEEVETAYAKIKGYSLADARPGAQYVSGVPFWDSQERRPTTHTSPSTPPVTRPRRTQLVAATKAVLADAKKAYGTLA